MVVSSWREPGGFQPITVEAGRREKKRDPLPVFIDKINEKYGTHFTEVDKVLLQMENDYAALDKWLSYAQNNDRKTFVLLFEKDIPNMTAARYEQNEDFFGRCSLTRYDAADYGNGGHGAV